MFASTVRKLARVSMRQPGINERNVQRASGTKQEMKDYIRRMTESHDPKTNITILFTRNYSTTTLNPGLRTTHLRSSLEKTDSTYEHTNSLETDRTTIHSLTPSLLTTHHIPQSHLPSSHKVSLPPHIPDSHPEPGSKSNLHPHQPANSNCSTPIHPLINPA